MSKGKQHEAEASEGARRATAEASASWALVGTGRWSARRKVSVVIEVLKGESLESLSRRHGVRRCCTNRHWPARCQSTRSSPADAIRHWSAEGGHPIEDLTAEDGLTPLPSWTPGAKAIADDGPCIGRTYSPPGP